MKTKSLGYPRIGADRQLKKSIEAYLKGAHSEAQLQEDAAFLRRRHLEAQKDAGIDLLVSSDFSLYDHVLDTAIALGVAQTGTGDLSSLEEMFLLARGALASCQDHSDHTGRALEMTKWFDTNYHYIVPEIGSTTRFSLRNNRWLSGYEEAQAWGFETQPVLLGPVSFLLLSKNPDPEGNRPLTRLSELLPLYVRILSELFEQGAKWVQLDEPCLGWDLGPSELGAFDQALRTLGEAKKRPKLLVTSYFESISEHVPWLGELPLDGLHLDLVTDPGGLSSALAHWPKDRVLSLGLVDGRNVWKADLEAAHDLLRQAQDEHPADNLVIAPSCSLLHCPLDLDFETEMAWDVRQYLAFSKQKLKEVALLGTSLDRDFAPERSASRALRNSRKNDPLVTRASVQARALQIQESDLTRSLPYEKRAKVLEKTLRLPPLPTTTIGSFPQTPEIRKARSKFQSGEMQEGEYLAFIEQTISDTIKEQERIGLDVLVHGEAERCDMVEYFADNLHGFLATKNGWVQSYGTRCVKPPIIFGDIERKAPLSLTEMRMAQKATKRPLKGMLTGPTTMLKWSFVRSDQPWEVTAQQMAWALRDEVSDLEKEGLFLIQVDEPALREGLPLKKSRQAAYLKAAVDAFRLATGGANVTTQIHTHMCYAEFHDIIDSIIALDADVISIESARSRTELLSALGQTPYPNEIGPGVFDIHSPRVPEVEEMAEHLRRACQVIPQGRLWVNPDCGLKTRTWPEVTEALTRMVEAAAVVRRELDVAITCHS